MLILLFYKYIYKNQVIYILLKYTNKIKDEKKNPNYQPIHISKSIFLNFKSNSFNWIYIFGFFFYRQ